MIINYIVEIYTFYGSWTGFILHTGHHNVGRGGSVVSSVPSVQRVAGPNTTLATMYGP